MLSSVTNFEFVGNQLTVPGTESAETMVVETDENGEILVGGQATGIASTEVESLQISAGGGDDQIDLSGFTASGITVQIDAGSGNDTVIGSESTDLIFGRTGNDIIQGGGGNDQIYGDSGNDTLSGDFGNDFIDGGDGEDSILGNAGNDLILGGRGNDSLQGGDGDDTIFGDTGVGDGSNGIDVIQGNDGDDVIYGEDNDDQISGGEGNDRVFGGVDQDLAVDSALPDVPRFDANFGHAATFGRYRLGLGDVTSAYAGEINRWEVDWGDGNQWVTSGSQSELAHFYQTAGQFNVVVIAYDQNGPVATTTGSIVVQEIDLVVANTDDVSDGNYFAGGLSLREAVEIANLRPGTDEITFADALTISGPQVIELERQLDIRTDINIIGPGSDQLSLSGGQPYEALIAIEPDEIGQRLTSRIESLNLANAAGTGIHAIDTNLYVVNVNLENIDAFGIQANDTSLVVEGSSSVGAGLHAFYIQQNESAFSSAIFDSVSVSGSNYGIEFTAHDGSAANIGFVASTLEAGKLVINGTLTNDFPGVKFVNGESDNCEGSGTDDSGVDQQCAPDDGSPGTTDGSASDGAGTNGATEDGTAEDGSSTGGSPTGGTTNDGTTTVGIDVDGAPDDGSQAGGTTDDGTTDDGTTDDGTTDDGTTDDGTTDDGTTDDGTTDDGTTDDGTTDDGTTDDGTTDDGTTDDGTTDDGTTDDGTTDDGTTDDGSTSVGAPDDGSTSGGTTDDGNSDDGNTDDGSTTGGEVDARVLVRPLGPVYEGDVAAFRIWLEDPDHSFRASASGTPVHWRLIDGRGEFAAKVDGSNSNLSGDSLDVHYNEGVIYLKEHRKKHYIYAHTILDNIYEGGLYGFPEYFQLEITTVGDVYAGAYGFKKVGTSTGTIYDRYVPDPGGSTGGGSGGGDDPPPPTTPVVSFLEAHNPDLYEQWNSSFYESWYTSNVDRAEDLSSYWSYSTTPYNPIVSKFRPWGEMLEGESRRIVRLQLSQASNYPVTVALSTGDLKANADHDFELLDETVTFAPGQTIAEARVKVFNDDTFELPETFHLSIEDAQNAVVSSTGRFYIGAIFDSFVNLQISDTNAETEEDPGAKIYLAHDPTAVDRPQTNPGTFDNSTLVDLRPTSASLKLNALWPQTTVPFRYYDDYRITLNFDESLINLYAYDDSWSGIVPDENDDRTLFPIESGVTLTPNDGDLSFVIVGLNEGEDTLSVLGHYTDNDGNTQHIHDFANFTVVNPPKNADNVIDVDSNNDGRIEEEKDDDIEDAQDHILAVNDIDANNNFVLDYADQSANTPFTPVRIYFRGLEDYSLQDSTFSFSYPHSESLYPVIGDPIDPVAPENAFQDYFRIWKLDTRAANAPDENAAAPFSSFIFTGHGTTYTAAELGFENGGPDYVDLFLEGIREGRLANNSTPNDPEITVTLEKKTPQTPFVDEETVIDSVNVAVVNPDLDVDSLNTKELGLPDSSIEEEHVEIGSNESVHQNAGTNKWDAPGKIIGANQNDADNDGVFDYVDFDGGGERFVPMVLRVPRVYETNDQSGAFSLPIAYQDLYFEFSLTSTSPQVSAIPADIAGLQDDYVRIWKKDGNVERDAVLDRVNFDQMYKATDLYGGSDYDTITLYIEVLAGGVDILNSKITAHSFFNNNEDKTLAPELVPIGDEDRNVDTVGITTVSIDADIDSRNRYGYSMPSGEDLIDERYEDVGAGKVVFASYGDQDFDGKLDAAPEIANGRFVPIKVRIPQNVIELARETTGDDISSDTSIYDKLTLKVDYMTADPLGNGNNSGNIRIWRKDGFEQRDPAVASSFLTSQMRGDYVAPGQYLITDLFQFGESSTDPILDEITLYVEGVAPSSNLGQERVAFSLLHDSNVIIGAHDTVRFTVKEFDLDVDSDNDNFFAPPERDAYEDSIELLQPGKVIRADRYLDSDGDGVADHFDGFNFDGIDGNEDDSETANRFTPLVIEVPKLEFNDELNVDFNESVYVAFAYEAFDESESGNLRLWARNSADRESFDEFLRPNVAYSVADLIELSQTDISSQPSGALTQSLTFFVEAVDRKLNVASQPIVAGLFVANAANAPTTPTTLPDDWASTYGYGDGNGDDGSTGGGDNGPGSGDPPYGSAQLGYIGSDTVRVTHTEIVSVFATDQFGQEGNDDGVEFTFSRHDGNVAGNLTVYYELIDGSPTSTALDPNFGYTDNDYSTTLVTNIDSNGRFIGSVTILAGTSSTALSVIPTNDSTSEWDETIEIRLIDNPFDAGTEEPDYILNVQNVATATIFDDDGYVGELDRNVDADSTGLVKDTVSSGAVSVGLHQGDTNVEIPLIPFANGLTYQDDDNLLPILPIELKLPNSAQNMSGLKAKVTFGGEAGQEVVFGNAGNFDPEWGYMRLVLMGPQDLADKLKTGHYDYDIEVQLVVDGELLTKTINGNTEIINRVNAAFGDDSYGKRWTHVQDDRLIPNDGSTGRFTSRGHRTESGIALIRGDSTSAWFKSENVNSNDVVYASNTASTGPWRNSTLESSDLMFGGQRYDWNFDNLNQNRMYQVFATWSSDSTRSDEARYDILGGLRLDNGVSGTIDQRYTPGEVDFDSRQWRSLGFYQPGGNSLQVSLSQMGNGSLVASDTSVVLVSNWDYQTPDGSFSNLEYTPQDSSEFSDDDRAYAHTLTMPDGGSFEFSSQGRLHRHSDVLGNRTRFDYEFSEGHEARLNKITTQGGLETTYHYDGGYLRSVESPTGLTATVINDNGFVRSIEYDSGVQNLLENGSTSSLVKTRFDYFAPGYRLSDVYDARGNQTKVVRSANERVHLIENADGAVASITPMLVDGLDAHELRRSISGQLGNLFLTTTIHQSKATFTEPGTVTEPGDTREFQTNHFGLVTFSTRPTGGDVDHDFFNVWSTARNEHGQIERYVEPAMYVASFDATSGNPSRETIGNKITKFEYTDNGNLELSIAGFESTNTRTSSTEYKTIALNGRSAEVVDMVTAFDGAKTKYFYREDYQQPGNDESFQPLVVIEDFEGPDQRVTKLSYTEPIGQQEHLIDDLALGLVKTTEVDEQTTTNEYYDSTDGHLVGLTRMVMVSGDGLKQKTELLYDDHRYINESRQHSVQVGTQTDTTYRSTNYVRDYRGLVVSKTLPAGASVVLDNDGTILFDENGIPVTETHTQGKQTTYVYDAMGNEREMTSNIGTSSSSKLVTTSTEYDAMNRVESVEDSGQLKTTFAYWADGNLKSETVVIPGADRVTEYFYDARNRLERKVSPTPGGYANGVAVPAATLERLETFYLYDNNNYVISESDTADFSAADAVRTHHYHSIHGEILANEQHYHFDRELNVYHPQTINFVDNDNPLTNNLVGHGNPLTRYVLDSAGRVHQTLTQVQTGNDGFSTVTTEYDNLGRLVKRTVPINETETKESLYDYDERDNLVATTITAPNYHSYEVRFYDGLDRLIAIDHPDPDPDRVGLVTKFAFDEYGNLAAKLEYEGSITDSIPSTSIQGLVNEAKDKSGTMDVRLTRYRYDANGNLLATVSPDMYGESTLTESLAPVDGSVVTASEYDFAGNPLSTILQFREEQGSEVTSQTTTFVYDSFGRIHQERSPLDNNGNRTIKTTTYTLDGSIHEVKNHLESDTGQVVSTSATTTYHYDNIGRHYQVVTSDGNDSIAHTTLSDKHGNAIRTIESNGRKTDHVFDNLNRMIQTTRYVDQDAIEGGTFNDPRVKSYQVYTVDGLSRYQIAQDGTAVETIYDEAGNLISTIRHQYVVQEDGTYDFETVSTTQYENFDANGKYRSVTDASGSTSTFVYDRFGRMIEEHRADSEAPKKYAFDAFGNLDYSTNRRGQIVSYEYAPTGLLLSEHLQADGIEHTFRYTPLGEIKLAETRKLENGQWESQSRYTYDYEVDRALDKFTQEFDVLGDQEIIETRFNTDPISSVSSETIAVGPAGAATDLAVKSRTFDHFGRNSRFQLEQNGTTTSATFNFGAHNVLDSIDYQHDTPSGIDRSAQVDYEHYADGRIQSVAYSANGNQPREQQVFFYDSSGREVKEINQFQTLSIIDSEDVRDSLSSQHGVYPLSKTANQGTELSAGRYQFSFGEGITGIPLDENTRFSVYASSISYSAYQSAPSLNSIGSRIGDVVESETNPGKYELELSQAYGALVPHPTEFNSATLVVESRDSDGNWNIANFGMDALTDFELKRYSDTVMNRSRDDFHRSSEPTSNQGRGQTIAADGIEWQTFTGDYDADGNVTARRQLRDVYDNSQRYKASGTDDFTFELTGQGVYQDVDGNEMLRSGTYQLYFKEFVQSVPNDFYRWDLPDNQRLGLYQQSGTLLPNTIEYSKVADIAQVNDKLFQFDIDAATGLDNLQVAEARLYVGVEELQADGGYALMEYDSMYAELPYLQDYQLDFVTQHETFEWNSKNQLTKKTVERRSIPGEANVLTTYSFGYDGLGNLVTSSKFNHYDMGNPSAVEFEAQVYVSDPNGERTLVFSASGCDPAGAPVLRSQNWY
ncbi:MAG: Calx-beta domain-containing protein [Planctomycetota bacterium]